MRMDYTPKSWQEKNAERLRHAFGMHDIIRERGAFSVAPDPEYNWARQAEQLQSKINKFREKTAAQRARNRSSAIISSPVAFTGNSADAISFNMQGPRTPFREMRSDIVNLLKSDPGVIAFQEAGNKQKIARLREFLMNQGYGLRGKSNNPIAFDRDQYRLVDRGSEFLSPDTYVGPRGAGPDVLRSKYANYLILKQLGGGPLRSFTNVHLAPSRNLPMRQELANMQLKRTIALQRALRGEYGPELKRIAMGDFNVNRPNIMKGFNRIGMGVQQGPRTHRVGTPDWIIGDGVRNLRAVATNSDHKALLANLLGIIR